MSEKKIHPFFQLAKKRKSGEMSSQPVKISRIKEKAFLKEDDDQKPNVEKRDEIEIEKSTNQRKGENPQEEMNPEDVKLRQEMEKMFPGISVMHVNWMKALLPQMKKSAFASLATFVAAKRGANTVYPAEQDVFNWARLDIRQTKVVILGQDPYHGPNQAHGLSFSVLRPTPPPPSLKNMFKELVQDENVEFKKPDHGDLTSWAEQGVLLLNAVLTVTQAQANSHKGRGWEEITDGAIKAVSDKCRHVVFILWGGFAQKKEAKIDGKKHLVLKGPHPSPLSAHRGFFGCAHFSKANKYLKEHGKSEINWGSVGDA